MKYIRKIVALVLTAIFVCAVVICAGIIFSIKNVNVSFIDYSGAYVEEYENCAKQLDTVKGTSILFLSEDDVKSRISDDHIRLVSYEKVFPCTVNVVMAERVETFAMYDGSKYAIFDDGGNFVRYSNDILNNLDKSPNVLLENIDENEIGIVSVVVEKFKQKFGYVRAYIEKISIANSQVNNKISLYFRSGLVIEIADYSLLVNEKMSAVYNKYITLTESEKLGGRILCYSLQSSVTDVRVIYSVN